MNANESELLTKIADGTLCPCLLDDIASELQIKFGNEEYNENTSNEDLLKLILTNCKSHEQFDSLLAAHAH